MKTLEFLFQETEIHFALQNDGAVMVNATEMAKAFKKRTNNYLANSRTKEFVKALKRTGNPVRLIEDRGRNGIYFCEDLALDFAMWLDVNFKVWVVKKIRQDIFGNYKKHWEAHYQQELAVIRKKEAKQRLLAGDINAAVDYFEAEKDINNGTRLKTKLIKAQYSLFNNGVTIL